VVGVFVIVNFIHQNLNHVLKYYLAKEKEKEKLRTQDTTVSIPSMTQFGIEIHLVVEVGWKSQEETAGVH